ncbi:MAG: alkaline phosphatase family protein [Balneolaceae bacterium]|nr:alkaline phosphatase family protein [Balneolaceae bacterium]
MTSRSLLLTLFWIGLPLLVYGQLYNSGPAYGSSKHVIFIGVDGLSPDGIREASTPALDRLMSEGSYSLSARGVRPTNSSPNWGSMLMGAAPEQHGVTSNGWREDRQPYPPTTKVGNRGWFPTIFDLIQDQRPEMEVGTVYHWKGFQNLFNRETPDYEKHGRTEEITTEIAIDYIESQKPNYLFVHLDHVDAAGHRDGHGSQPYYASVTKADSLIGLLLDALDETFGDSYVVMVSSDHGGVGFGHGGDSLAEIEIPWIIAGQGIKSGLDLQSRINTFDSPSMAAYLLGVQQPQAWIGRPVVESLQNEEPPVFLYPQNVVDPEPRIIPSSDPALSFGGLFVGMPDPIEIRHSNPDRPSTIHFTTDGTEPTPSSAVYENAIMVEDGLILRAKQYSGEKATSLEAQGSFRVLSPETPKHVKVDFYEIEEIEALPDFFSMEPISSTTTWEISLNHLELPREENIAAVFTAYVEVKEGGTWRSVLASDDGSKMFVNGIPLIDNDGNHGIIEVEGEAPIPAGIHEIRVEWFNGAGGKWLGVFVEGPGMPYQEIPYSMYVDQPAD